MSKHTKGPWYPVQYACYWALQSQPHYDDNDDLFNDQDHWNAADNAKLAAASPELKELVETLIDYINRPFDELTYSMTQTLVEKGRNVLNKIENQ